MQIKLEKHCQNMKRLYYLEKDICDLTRNSFLFFDNNALIAFILNPDLFVNLISLFDQRGLALTSIPSVRFEFLRQDSYDNLKIRINFFNKYIGLYPIEKHLDTLKTLIPVIQKASYKCSYPDFLLYCALYKFKSRSYLLTSDHKDFNQSLLDRKTVITVDNSKEIHNLAIYTFSEEKLNKFDSP